MQILTHGVALLGELVEARPTRVSGWRPHQFVGDIDGLRGYRQRGLTLMSTTQIPTKTTPLTTPRQGCDTHPAGGPR